ncbi:helix-turn-helix domain-containing protein, partial [Trichloromonas sp.]|uniref:helix-turn-helix domain-containing protein n=1 Tax=Trichloromonas sp. TaxID=3069249 RepID=UPI003D814E85
MTEIEPLTIGITLKQRREELGLSLPAIAEKTRIRANFLLDMEADRFDGFPGDAYLLGFLKLYAETLGLDAASVIDQFRA